MPNLQYGALATGKPSTAALWTWDTTNPAAPTVTSFPFGPTKTGLLPEDLREFVGVPLQIYTNPPQPLTDANLMRRIRWAEDYVEQRTTILLCPTFVASDPVIDPILAFNLSIPTTSPDGIQRLGVDYDLYDVPYDFKFDRALDEGWMAQQLRYRPLRIYLSGMSTAVFSFAYIYPLLNEYFAVPNSWFKEDRDYGLGRLVPSANVEMLPLFALQLSVQGFSNSVPAGINVQYSAGLSAVDYQTRFHFMKELVLCQAAIGALQQVQGTINMGLDSHQTLADGVQFQAKYNPKGAFSALIDQHTARREELMESARWEISGPSFETLG